MQVKDNNLFDTHRALHLFPQPTRSWALYDPHNVGLLHTWHTVADGECTVHMNSINFVRFVFLDSNPTGNPKSGGTHSLWSEGKLGFLYSFSTPQAHPCHCRALCVTQTWQNISMNLKCAQKVQCKFPVPAKQPLFPVICYLTDISWPQSAWKAAAVEEVEIFKVVC